MAPHPYLDHSGPVALAHRGGAGEAPENSPAAFMHAVSLGFTYLETDVHATSDGICVVFHDATLDRTTDCRGAIASMTWSQVRKARIDGREPIWTLEEMLDALPEARINIDIKADAAVEPTARLLADRDVLDRVLVGSFSHRRLTRIRRILGSRLATSMSPGEIAMLMAGLSGRAARHAVAAQIPRTQGPFPVATARFVDVAHTAGMAVHVWTVNDPETMSDLLDLGVDGIVTDQPSVLREVLRSRGQWNP